MVGSPQRARGLAPGFYLRCPPVGAAPRIGQRSVPERLCPGCSQLGRVYSHLAKCEAKRHDAQCRRPCFIGPSFFHWAARDLARRLLGTRISQPLPRLWRVSGPPWTTPRRPAGEHHEHSGARNRPCGARRGIASFLSGLPKPSKDAHHQHQRGSAEGGCVALLQVSTCAARPWAQPLKFNTMSESL